MWFKMQEADYDFLQTAEKKFTVECYIEASRMDVWNAFIDPTTWNKWFPDVDYARGDAPYGLGSFRESKVNNSYWKEYIAVFEEGKCWGYYIDKATLPVATKQLECTFFEDSGTGTLVRWTIAMNPRLLMKIFGRVMEAQMNYILKKALKNLAQYIKTQKTHSG